MTSRSYSYPIWGWTISKDKQQNTKIDSFLNKHALTLGLDAKVIADLRAGKNLPDPDGCDPDGVEPSVHLVKQLIEKMLNIELSIIKDCYDDFFVGIEPMIMYPWDMTDGHSKYFTGKSQADYEHLLQPIFEDMFDDPGEPDFEDPEIFC